MDSEILNIPGIKQVLQNYFQEAMNIYDSSHSKVEFYSRVAQIANNDLNLYGETLIEAALVITKLNIMNADRSQFNRFPGDNQFMADGMFVMQVEQLIQLATALALALGERGIWKLFEMLNAQDEDIATLAVSCFDSESIKHPQIISQFKTALSKAEGTVYKLNLALQLMFYGDRSAVERLSKEHGIEVGKITQLVIIGIASDKNPYNSIKSWKSNRH